MKHLAIDIGAESGRGMLGWIEDGRLCVDEIHRFPNAPLAEEDRLYWDIDHLLHEVNVAIARAGGEIASVGIDTWAVDYVLLDSQGLRMERPRCYRDLRAADVF
ncbi:MAG TPA: hypothetical protein PKA27_07065, partial [Fimbriimonadaceae bacterium]|nr:hypothetical protein [Fimbriimonadaceae bacterium]